jgi:DNA gyrase/topoisomerase IV subunit A
MPTNIRRTTSGEFAPRCQAASTIQDLSTPAVVPLGEGPIFPTGGHILNSRDELKEIYKTGSGRFACARPG